MLKISPLKAWRYNPNKNPDFSKVIAPPYDVIGPNKLKALQDNSPNNVVRIDLPQEQDGKDKYALAGQQYQAWKDEAVLSQDETPSLYLYFQTYTLPDGSQRTRKGFFARRRLETFDEGGVKPHEKTFAGPKADRLNLTKATHANLSPIFGLYSDADNQLGPKMDGLAKGDPVMDIPDFDGQAHRVWKIDDPAAIEGLLASIQQQSVMIADGHHRYETALNYREFRTRELGDKVTGDEGFHHVLMYFCCLQDPGLVVLPTHRILATRPEVAPELARKLLSEYAEIKSFSLSDAEAAVEYMEREGASEHLLAWAHEDGIEVLCFDPEKILKSESLNHLHFALRDLDVTILHSLVLEEVFGVSKGAQREYGNIHYVKNIPDALKMVQEKKTYGFLMNATKVAQMEAVTEIGETMPQKSTFFYPKVPTGLLFHDLD